MPALDPNVARSFATEWIEAWNAHDVERVLGHYSEDVELSSPLIVSLAWEASGTLKGKSALRAYWTKALGLLPNLHFDLLDVLVGVTSMTIHYRGHRGTVAETLHFDRARRVRFATSCYSVEPQPNGTSAAPVVRNAVAPPLRLTGRSSSHFTRVAALRDPLVFRV